jgi:hypothetical protein
MAMGFHESAAATTTSAETLTPLAIRVRGEYKEMPGLRLTAAQAARLFGMAADVAVNVLDELRRASILERSEEGLFGLISEPSRRRSGRTVSGGSSAS